VLKPGGRFINGDRYALDDISLHTRIIQEEVSGYFKVLTNINRLDLLEHWVVHLFSDESENHVMRESAALQQLNDAGFTDVRLSHRMEVNALVTALKPVHEQS
jgi:tRNA (cmo5U34)-methyltransferase